MPLRSFTNDLLHSIKVFKIDANIRYFAHRIQEPIPKLGIPFFTNFVTNYSTTFTIIVYLYFIVFCQKTI